MTKFNDDTTDEIVEEVWPSLQKQQDDEGQSTSVLTTGFGQYNNVIKIIIQPKPFLTYLEIECVLSLSPLDMINLSCGTHDATGQCVWMGALFFIETLAAANMQNEICKYFQNKNVLELGCGTGVAGLALMLLKKSTPKHLTLSDADNKVLDLCRRNCEKNLSTNIKIEDSSSTYSIHQLCWGCQDYSQNALSSSKSIDSSNHHQHHSYDTVFATDVIYDLECLPDLLWTVDQYLTIDGHFILSHIPRACLPNHDNDDEKKKSTYSNYQSKIEQIILTTTQDYGLELVTILRPSDLKGSIHGTNQQTEIRTSLNSTSFDEMEDVGASIFIFCKNIGQP